MRMTEDCMAVQVPYDKDELSFTLPRRRLAGVFAPALAQKRPAFPEKEILARALAEPFGSLRLEELARGKRSAVIIASDHTRPVPSKLIMPALLSALRQANPGMQISILIATGFHRASSNEELRYKFGDEIVENERIIMHDCRDKNFLLSLGRLPSGGELWLNKLALQCDLLLAEGFIEPHFFAGFSGGRKSVLPGIAGEQSVLSNHCAEFIDSRQARAGCLEGNPMHEDMLWAAQKAGLAFIVNVILNQDKQIIAAYAGHPESAHLAGCEKLRRLALCEVPESQIIIVGNGGYPLDQNIYQAVKGMSAAESAIAPGGVIIMLAACRDGHGGEAFYRSLAEASSPLELLQKIRRVPAAKTRPDQWESQILARILAKNPVIMVSEPKNHALIEAMHMLAATDVEQALQMAREKTGAKAKIAVIPDGVAAIVRKI